MNSWKFQSEIVRIKSHWLTLIAERWRDNKLKEVEYWRVMKSDSVLALPLQNGRLYCTAPTFRPGIGRETLDLPGGRVQDESEPPKEVPQILQRELGIAPSAITKIQPLNAQKWNINSSFSNQGLWAFVATIDPHFEIPDERVGACVPADHPGVVSLLGQLDCLQCRAVLTEWLIQKG